MLMVFFPCPRSINLEPFGQEFSVQVSHVWEWEACFGATYQSLAPASQSSRRGYNLRVRFQQNRSVYTVLPAVRYLPLLEKSPAFPTSFRLLCKCLQSKVSSSRCCLLKPTHEQITHFVSNLYTKREDLF